jgi:hypothetical protein
MDNDEEKAIDNIKFISYIKSDTNIHIKEIKPYGDGDDCVLDEWLIFMGYAV